ncbi:helix-turn-helix domain-containing protein [Humibacter ginsengisoli]
MVEKSHAVTDPVMLRALAHPLRQRIIWELAARDHLRAADLARITAEPANSLSFHLRTLAKAGLIKEVPEKARDGRDRVWTMAFQQGLYFPDTSDMADRFMAERLEWIKGILDESLPRDPAASRLQYMGAVVLTKEEAEQMAEEVVEVFEKWRVRGAAAAEEHPDDPSRVFHYTAAYVANPWPSPESAAEVHDLGSSAVDGPARAD